MVKMSLAIFAYSCGHAIKSYNDEEHKIRYKLCPECKQGELELVSNLIQ